MSELYFRLGPMEGFTAVALADKKEGYATPIRELLQNSLDASRSTGKMQCQINIYIKEIDKSQIPCIKHYESVLKKAIDTQDAMGSYNENSKRVVNYIEKQLEKQKCQILMFSDDGSGMPQNQMDAILTGNSVKGSDEEKSGGSFGVGHLSSYSLSSIRYVLYATKYKDDSGVIRSLSTGSAILAGHEWSGTQRGNRGRIVEKRPNKETNPIFVYPEKFPDFINPEMAGVDTGTLVTILGLTESWGEEAEYAIASNFFHAISHGALNIKVHEKGKDERDISENEMDTLIGRQKHGKHARGDSILSGQAVHQALRTITDPGGMKDIPALTNGDKVHVYIKTDREANPAIVLIRNGMLIARHDSMLSVHVAGLRNNPDYEPFTAVIDVDQEDAPKLFRLVKGAEGPDHNRLYKNKLTPEEEDELRILFKELCEKIKKHLKKMERDSFGLPLFPIPGKSYSQTGHGEKSSGQNEKAIRQTLQRNRSRNKNTGNGKGRKKPVVTNRTLDSISAVRYKEGIDIWDVKLRVTTNKVDAKDDVYLSIFLGEDNDKDAINTALNFKYIEVNEEPKKVPQDNKRSINLGPLKKDTRYNIIAKVKKPAKLGDMKLSLLPIFGLKRRKNIKE